MPAVGLASHNSQVLLKIEKGRKTNNYHYTTLMYSYYPDLFNHLYSFFRTRQDCPVFSIHCSKSNTIVVARDNFY